MITITSKKEGFRRCGVAHPAGPTDYEDGSFTKEQVETMQADPMLVVVVGPIGKKGKKPEEN